MVEGEIWASPPWIPAPRLREGRPRGNDGGAAGMTVVSVRVGHPPAFAALRVPLRCAKGDGGWAFRPLKRSPLASARGGRAGMTGRCMNLREVGIMVRQGHNPGSVSGSVNLCFNQRKSAVEHPR